MSTFPVEITIGREVPIAVQDFGGDGPPILLLHGAGGSLIAWAGLAPGFAERHRVIAMDLRGHGRSGDGDWSWEAVLDDIEVVVAQFALSNPVIVGHSFGGMIAGMWARRHPESPGVVSLDGHRSAETDPRHYHGIDPSRRDIALSRLRELFDMQAQAMAQPLPPEMAAAQPERQLADYDGRLYLRPNETITRWLRHSPEFRDALPVFAEVQCPLLIVLAKRNLPMTPEDLHELMDGHRAGLRHDLAAISARRPNLKVVEIDAHHGMVAQEPAKVQALVTDFIENATAESRKSR